MSDKQAPLKIAQDMYDLFVVEGVLIWEIAARYNTTTEEVHRLMSSVNREYRHHRVQRGHKYPNYRPQVTTDLEEM